MNIFPPYASVIVINGKATSDRILVATVHKFDESFDVFTHLAVLALICDLYFKFVCRKRYFLRDIHIPSVLASPIPVRQLLGFREQLEGDITVYAPLFREVNHFALGVVFTVEMQLLYVCLSQSHFMYFSANLIEMESYFLYTHKKFHIFAAIFIFALANIKV